MLKCIAVNRVVSESARATDRGHKVCFDPAMQFHGPRHNEITPEKLIPAGAPRTSAGRGAGGPVDYRKKALARHQAEGRQQHGP